MEVSSAPHGCVLSVLDGIAPVRSDLWLSHGNSRRDTLGENKLVPVVNSTAWKTLRPSGISHQSPGVTDAGFSVTHLLSQVRGPGSSFITWVLTSSHRS